MDMALVAVLAECWYPKKSWRKKTINSCLGMILVYIIYTHVYIYIYMCYFESFTVFSVGKNSPANAGDTGDSRLILGSGRSLWPKEEEKTKEGEMATHSRIPAGIIPWTEEPDGLQSIGSQRVWHDRANTCTCIVFNIPSHFDLSSQLWLSFELCNYKVYWVYRKLWGQLTASTHRVIHTITQW